MILPVTAVLATFAAIWMWSAWDARRRLLARLRGTWGEARALPSDMDDVASFFRAHPPGKGLDDRTWNDLLLDQVFATLDRTESRIGQQMLYRRLRSAPQPPSLAAFEAMVEHVQGDAAVRERAQMALARLADPAAYHVHHLTEPDVLVRKPWHVVFPLWTAAIVITIAAAAIWHGLILVVIPAIVVNLVIRAVVRDRVGGEIVWFRHLAPLLSTADALRGLDMPATAAIMGTLSQDVSALGRLRSIARWVSRDPAKAGDFLTALLELPNTLLLMDVNAVYFASDELARCREHLLRMMIVVGEIDAAIAIASLRYGVRGWIRPTFADAAASSVFVDLVHPLLDDAVPNSITLAPPHGVLVTGSNMSGKSTFLRTVGVNVVLAQTINTCFAREYRAPVLDVRGCIGREDDLEAGKSYYLVEVESVLSLVRAGERPTPHLFLFDELFRGTNAVERIAAGEAVLHALVEGGKPHIVIAATHDGELVDLLRHEYAVYHLSDSLTSEGLSFDYHLTPGPATSRNAIALLRLNGAPAALVDRALALAAALDRRRAQSI